MRTTAGHAARTIAEHGTLAACEQRLESQSRSIPTVAIVGASYTAGGGPNNPELSWAAVLARGLHWNAVIYGVSGAGYVDRGSHRLGPVRRLLEAEQLRSLGPALVIIQAGHDDLGVRADTERRQVQRAIQFIHAEAPQAQVALLTVFIAPKTRHLAAYDRIDKVIVGAARAADPDVIIMDPLTGHWKFARHRNGLHPSAAGDAWIARKVAAILRAHGVEPQPRTATTPVVCIRAGSGVVRARSRSRAQRIALPAQQVPGRGVAHRVRERGEPRRVEPPALPVQRHVGHVVRQPRERAGG